jgi:hypothetical protein
MSSADQSSVIVRHLLDGLGKALPESAWAQLGAYEPRASQLSTTNAAEWQRAYRCAQWAADTVSLPEHDAVRGKARKALEVVKEVTQALRSQYENLLQVAVHQQTSAAYEVEITWVYEAVDVASEVAAKVGWEAVPWTQLVEDVLAVA